jgi:cytochrome c oxidase subunit 1/cytochrome c oxidase subunit I+III
VTVADYSREPRILAESYDSPLAERLKTLWETKPGIIGWLSTVDHKEIGIRYIVTSFAFLVLGGIEALIVRLQLAQPEQSVVTPTQYNELFSMHGVTMIFLYALPVLSGFSNYLWPLILGSRDMALPRLNAFSYWTFLFSGLFLYAGFAIGAGPNDGWFNYVPYALKPFNPGPSQDFYALGFIFFGLSVTAGGINFMVTALRTRAPGMSINRFPMMIWGTLTANAGNLLAVPSVSLAFFMLWTDRQFGTHFFNVEAGGQPLLWQHLFWMFGHPWVYAIVLPAMSIVSDGLPVFCRRPLVGHTAVALATVITMIIGFGVWVHHMFATGLPNLAMSFFNAASFVIVIPSAVSVFAWVATIWTGRFIYATASLFFVSFIWLFVIGGVSGFLTGSVPVDWQVTDTYFVVGHIHYVLIGINVFPVVGGHGRSPHRRYGMM